MQSQSICIPTFLLGSPGGAVLKNLPANVGAAGATGSISGWENPLEEEMATCFTILAWKITWTEELGEITVQGVAKSQTQLND